ncbi:MAG: cupin domain-containing protein [Alphaproteobacteria bacterium]|nr:cupin domain-containing protein [Alphaproteobacteria bacterium]
MSEQIIRTKHLKPEDGFHFRHPLNPNSDAQFFRLSRPTGLTRAHVNLLRVPPGKEAFILHRHSVQEEWSYIVEGEGTAQIGEEKTRVTAGDFIAFPLNGKAHTIVNTGTSDLVYLTGGDDTPTEIGHFPSINKKIIFSEAGVDIIDTSAAKHYSLEDFISGNLK